MSDLRAHIQKLREDFAKGALNEEEVHPDPFFQFETWLSQAVQAQIPEVQAMTLSTVSDEQPSSRVVYLREFSDHKFWFYGNYFSKKGSSLEKNNKASLSFFWPGLERQIRLEGMVEKASAEMSDAYFHARPRESQIGAWASAQSQQIRSRKELEDNFEKFRAKFEGQPVPRPEYWGGWVFQAHYYEFWQGRLSRLHDRIAYVKKKDNWEIFRLAP